ncbi:hypothetical protein [Mycobacterium sp. E2462]|uniref:hypothetical protein n=1 Tax=Mycobacterium sp. E2462 TaxID=1834133 RepID=UPI000B30907A|nr:hypothetical protein [Mycobacterium sp. E2462]
MTPTTPDPDRPDATHGHRQRLQLNQIRALAAAALTTSLVLGGGFLAVNRLHATPSDALDHPGDPLDDSGSKAQAVASARQIVGVAQLHTVSAGYSLMSCKNQQDPPYQGAVYVTFALPPRARGDLYFAGLAATLADRGWREGLPPNNHPFARTLTRDGVTAVVYRQDDDPASGVARIYGQCRNVNDHRGDAAAWVDVTQDVAPAP